MLIIRTNRENHPKTSTPTSQQNKNKQTKTEKCQRERHTLERNRLSIFYMRF